MAKCRTTTKRWIILNVNQVQWGDEDYGSETEAKQALRSFFKGVPCVRFHMFSFKQVDKQITHR